MAGYLIDTDILVDHLRGSKKATEALHLLYMEGEPLFSSVICEAEIFANIRGNERETAESVFRYIKSLPVDSQIARQAGSYRQRFRKSHQVQIPDALIAATAKLNQAKLVTRNKKHYPMPDVKLKTPY